MHEKQQHIDFRCTTVWTGKTWPHKDYLKTIGGVWDGSIKAWVVPPQPPGTRIRKLPGVNVEQNECWQDEYYEPFDDVPTPSPPPNDEIPF